MSAETFQKAVAFILPHEEAFARGHWGDERFVVAENVGGDPGGVTKYGIDARSHPSLDVAHLDRAAAIAIYGDEWKATGFDALPPKLAIACFDVRVNGGSPVKWLQQAINDTRPAGAAAIDVDGDLGRETVAAAWKCDQERVVDDFIAERNARFERLAQHPGMAQFLAGWEARDADLHKYLASVAQT